MIKMYELEFIPIEILQLRDVIFNGCFSFCQKIVQNDKEFLFYFIFFYRTCDISSVLWYGLLGFALTLHMEEWSGDSLIFFWPFSLFLLQAGQSSI